MPILTANGTPYGFAQRMAELSRLCNVPDITGASKTALLEHLHRICSQSLVLQQQVENLAVALYMENQAHAAFLGAEEKYMDFVRSQIPRVTAAYEKIRTEYEKKILEGVDEEKDASDAAQG